MRCQLLALVALATISACVDDANSSASVSDGVCTSNLVAGVVETTLTAGGATHAVRIFIPSARAETGLLPTVLNWHGNGGNGNDHAAYTEYEALAEQEGFVVVHPTGIESADLPVFGVATGWELIDGLDSPSRDDIAFAHALIDELVANWCADANRIYSIGMSNGALFTSTLVCAMADRLAGAASVAGVYHSPSCAPTRPVPYVAFHAIDDGVVPYETGGETIFPELNESILALGAFDAFAAFAAGFGCDPDPTASDLGVGTTRFEYVNCDGAIPMTFYATDSPADGHSWPGTSMLGLTTDDVDATLASWQFFEPLSLGQP